MLTNPNDWPVDPTHGRIIEALAPDRILPVLREHIRTNSPPKNESSPASGVACDTPGSVEFTQRPVCRAIEALYDPGEHVRIAYVLFNDGNPGRRRTWPDGDVCYVRYPVRQPMSRRGRIVNVGGFDVELYRFPSDRRLRGLRKFAGRDRAARAWQHWLSQDESALELQPDSLRRSLLRYVPEQKWIVFLQARCYDLVAEEQVKRAIVVRSADAAACQRIYSRVLAMRRERHRFEGFFRVPKPVALDTNLGMLAIRWVWGQSLLELLQTGDSQAIMGRVAAGLNALHQTTIDHLEVRSAEDDLNAAKHCADDIATVLPALRSHVDSVVQALAASPPEVKADAYRTIHNDFHWNQLRGRTQRLTILDLERCARGDPWVDVATFATQLSMLPVRDELNVGIEQAGTWVLEFLNAWEAETGRAVDVRRIRWYSVVALLTLARGMVRHLRPGWPALLQLCLERALETARQRDDSEMLV
ncbi:MAG: aminoglycoside phosphotransferase family protein [Phycisphaerae bacterium]